MRAWRCSMPARSAVLAACIARPASAQAVPAVDTDSEDDTAPAAEAGSRQRLLFLNNSEAHSEFGTAGSYRAVTESMLPGTVVTSAAVLQPGFRLGDWDFGTGMQRVVDGSYDYLVLQDLALDAGAPDSVLPSVQALTSSFAPLAREHGSAIVLRQNFAARGGDMTAKGVARGWDKATAGYLTMQRDINAGVQRYQRVLEDKAVRVSVAKTGQALLKVWDYSAARCACKPGGNKTTLFYRLFAEGSRPSWLGELLEAVVLFAELNKRSAGSWAEHIASAQVLGAGGFPGPIDADEEGATGEEKLALARVAVEVAEQPPTDAPAAPGNALPEPPEEPDYNVPGLRKLSDATTLKPKMLLIIIGAVVLLCLCCSCCLCCWRRRRRKRRTREELRYKGTQQAASPPTGAAAPRPNSPPQQTLAQMNAQIMAMDKNAGRESVEKITRAKH